MIKTVGKSVLHFISKAEKVDPKPTIVCFKPMTKREYDEYMDSLTEFKRGKVVSKASKAGEILYRRALSPDDKDEIMTLESGVKVKREKGVFIYNAFYDGKELEQIKDRDIAVEFLMGVVDIDWANELESTMRGQSILDEEEEKNSVGQSDSH